MDEKEKNSLIERVRELEERVGQLEKLNIDMLWDILVSLSKRIDTLEKSDAKNDG